MASFRIGDIVRLVKKIENMPGGYNWIEDMDEFIDATAQVEDIEEYNDGIIYKLKWIYHGNRFGVSAECLELESDLERIESFTE